MLSGALAEDRVRGVAVDQVEAEPTPVELALLNTLAIALLSQFKPNAQRDDSRITPGVTIFGSSRIRRDRFRSDFHRLTVTAR